MKDRVFDTYEGTDMREGIRGFIVAVVLVVNAFADRFDYMPLSGTESSALIGVLGLVFYGLRKIYLARSRR